MITLPAHCLLSFPAGGGLSGSDPSKVTEDEEKVRTAGNGGTGTVKRGCILTDNFLSITG
jgi:hypothetical protein